MNSTCGHQPNLLALELLKVIILCGQRSRASVHSGFHSRDPRRTGKFNPVRAAA